MKIQKRCLVEDLPEDIVIAILSRLPVKSVVRCMCVCKKWSSLINANKTHLINAHLQQSSATKLSIIVGFDIRLALPKLLLLSDETIVKDLQVPELADKVRHVNVVNTSVVVGSCNGLVCFNLSDDYTSILLWNPATRVVRKLPEPMSLIKQGRRGHVFHLSFGFDHINKDYKLVRVVENTSIWELRVQIYTESSDSWKEVNGISGYRMVPFCFVILNGVLYLLGKNNRKRDDHEINLKDCILTFNLCREEFQEILELPRKSECFQFLKWKESFAVVESMLDEFVHNFWIMNNDGSKYSWTKLFKINSYVRDNPFYLIGTWKNKLIFRTQEPYDRVCTGDRELILVDVNNNQTTIRKCSPSEAYIYTFDYVETLVPV
ncbi:hypothetical protein UlMin_015696 [Ulmus minor]